MQEFGSGSLCSVIGILGEGGGGSEGSDGVMEGGEHEAAGIESGGGWVQGGAGDCSARHSSAAGCGCREATKRCNGLGGEGGDAHLR